MERRGYSQASHERGHATPSDASVGGRESRARRRSVAALVAAALLLLGSASTLEARNGWEFEGRLGGAWNVSLPIVIRQSGHDDLRWTARWNTQALQTPLYYSLRVARWRDNAAWAVDLTHHKLYLENPPPEVRNLSISHGYNLLTLQRLHAAGNWRYGGAAGAVVAHPESEVRGQRFDEHGGMLGSGQYVAGPTAGALVGHSVRVAGGLYATVEARLTLSLARVPIANGSASVPNLALHVSAGFGWTDTD
jgi:hypothetical protein